VEIAPWRTKVVYLCPVKELESDFENAPIQVSENQMDYPILRWKDKSPFKKKYELMYGARADLSGAKIVGNIAECYFQLPEEMIKNDKIFWKVRSTDLTENNRYSPWSRIFELYLKSNVGSFVFHEISEDDTFAKLGFWENIAWGGGGPINILERDYEIKKEGAYSLKCQNTFDTSYSFWTNYNRYASSTRLPKVAFEEKYLLSAWIKTEGTGIKAFIGTILKGEEGESIEFIKSNMVAGSNDWTKIELKFTIPSLDVKTFNILFQADGKGTAWCSGMKLERCK